MSHLTPEQGRLLLSIARVLITKKLGIFAPLAKTSDHPWLNEPAATFVTIKIDGELRGCIGSLKAHHSLMNDLQNNATAAAFEDPRFSPLTKDELDQATIEISLLGDAEPIDFSDEEDALAKLHPHVDGIIFMCGRYRSTFLPQVWEQLPTPSMFMAHLKQKAGLAPDFWSNDVLLYRYAVQKFSES